MGDSPAARMPSSGYSYFNTPSSYGSHSRQATPSIGGDGIRRGGPGNTPYTRGSFGSTPRGDHQNASLGPTGILSGLDDDDGDNDFGRGDNGYTSYGHSGNKGGAGGGRDSLSSRGAGRSPFGRTTRSGGFGGPDSSMYDDSIRDKNNDSYQSYGHSGGATHGHGYEANLYSSGHNLMHPEGGGTGSSSSSSGGSRNRALGGGNEGMLSVDDICRCWLVVSGFYPDNHRMTRVLDLLNSRGSVQAVKESTGNWVLVKFPSNREAVRVQQQADGKMLSNGTVIGARQLDAHMAQSMHLRLSSDGVFVNGSGGGGYEEYDGILSGSDYAIDGVRSAATTSYGGAGPEGRMIDPNEDPWATGGSNRAGGVTFNTERASLSQDPEYVAPEQNASESSSLRVRHPSRGRTRGSGSGSGGNSHTPQNIRLKGSHVEVAGPVSPSLYLRPVKRDSVCDLVMKFFGFR